MELQYVVTDQAESREVQYLLEHKRQVAVDQYEAHLPDGRRALLKRKGNDIYVYY